jgi:hypothetical protein
VNHCVQSHSLTSYLPTERENKFGKGLLMTFLERFKEYLRREEEEQKKEEYFRRKNMAKSCNTIIREHYERMKDDPEH